MILLKDNVGPLYGSTMRVHDSTMWATMQIFEAETKPRAHKPHTLTHSEPSSNH